MTSLFNRYATPFITGLFLVSLISGIALFFHVGPSGFHGMHEWLSMVLILPFVLHLWKNWRPMTAYFRHLPMALALGVSLVAAAVFLLPTGSEGRAGGPPQFALARMVLNAPIETAAPLFGTDGAGLRARLGQAGFAVAEGNPTLAEIATASGKTDADLAAALSR